MTMLLALLALIQAPQTTSGDLTNQAAPQMTRQERVEVAADDAAPQTAPRVVCHRETVVGSNRQRRVCTTEQQRDLSRENARRILERNTGGVAGETIPGVAGE